MCITESCFEALITPVTVGEKILEDIQQGNRFQQVAVSILIDWSRKVACGEEKEAGSKFTPKSHFDQTCKAQLVTQSLQD